MYLLPDDRIDTLEKFGVLGLKSYFCMIMVI